MKDETGNDSKLRYVAGCMTGTSLDALDVALVRIEGRELAMKASLVRSHTIPLGDLAEPLRGFSEGRPMTAGEVAGLAEELAHLHLKALMEFVDSDSVGILWDIHHPYRSAGESPSETWQTLGKWIRYTHWKDSFPRGADYQLCLIGGGDLPLEEIFRVLKQGGYSGYLTLEWEKKWHPEIEEPEKAFPGFVRVMRGLISTHEGQ